MDSEYANKTKYRSSGDVWVIINKLADIIIYHTEGCIVEVGMGRASTPLLASVAKRNDVKLYSCDVKPYTIEPLFAKHTIFEGRSLDFIKVFSDIPSIVLIDGLHESETVQAEVDFFLEVMHHDGVIFMHDTLPFCRNLLEFNRCGNVYLVRQKLERDDKVDCFTWPYTNKHVGITMVKKRKRIWIEVGSGVVYV